MQLERAFLHKLLRVGKRFGNIEKECMQLLGGFEVKFGNGVFEPRCVVEQAVGGDTHQCVMWCRVIFVEIVRVVCGNQLCPALFGKREQRRLNRSLRGDSMSHNLDIKILAKNFAILVECRKRRLVAAGFDSAVFLNPLGCVVLFDIEIPRKLALQARRRRHKPLAIFA